MSQLIKNQILRRLDREDFCAIEPFLERVPLHLHEDLITPGVQIRYVYFPEGGICSIVAGSEASGAIEVGQIGFEGMTDHVSEPDDCSILRYFVQVESTAWRVEARRYWAWIRSRPRALHLVTRYNQAMTAQIAYTALSHGSYTIEERLARWLLMCFDRVEGDAIPMVHDFIAATLAVRRSGVTTALHVLEGHQAIRATRGMIRLRDRELLMELAQGGYGQPEAEYLRLMGPLAQN